MNRGVSTILFLTLALTVAAQNLPGTWRGYLSFSNAHKIAGAANKVWCATDGGLFFHDLSDNSLNKMGTSEGLSDIGIQTIAFSEQNQVLVIAYKNSNIDLVFANQLFNLADLKRKLVNGDKTIYNISFHGTDAYLSCGFGIVVVNLVRKEVKATYIIGQEGAQLPVYDTEVHGNLIYAATRQGILTADVQHPNLLDFRNWSRVTNIPNAGGKFNHLCTFKGRLYAVYTPGLYWGDEIYALTSGQWVRRFNEIGLVNDLQPSGEFLTITTREEVFVYDGNETLTGRIEDYRTASQTISPITPRSACITGNGTFWIADFGHGLMQLNGQVFEQNLPEGPANNFIFSMTANGGDLWVAAGGRTDPWNNQFREPLFQRYAQGEWRFYNKNQYPSMTGFWDIVQVAVHPSNPEHLFVASWGGGVLEFSNGQMVKRYNNLNSPLETAIPDQPQEPYTRIGGMAFDNDKTLWVTNSQSSNVLHSLAPTGEWKSFNLPEIAGQQFTIGQVIVTKNGDKWIVVPRGRDVYVVNKEVTKKKYLPVTSYFNNGQTEIFNRMNDVYSIAEDLSGDIWVGTSKGVAVFAIPERVWQDNNYYAYQPGLDLKDDFYHPLLDGETITAIAVDGANRKWLGTKNSGVYLVSEKGNNELLHFNTENSPLISNTITSIAISPKTGEVFIGTDAGLVSYQGDAPAGSKTFAEAYVYPNPVRETHHGPVTIEGLIKDTDVKITDIAGNLVHQSKSLGSRLIWDGKNLNGNRVKTGVYLIMLSDKAGDQTHILKLLFIH